jgi:hypothetical protein
MVWRSKIYAPTTDAATVSQLRDLVHSPSVCSALERNREPFRHLPCEKLARVLSDQSQTHGENIARVGNGLDEPI